MGLTYVDLEVAHPARPGKREEVRLLVDSGAIYSVLPAKLLGKLGVEPTGTKKFILANGEGVTRKYGNALFFFEGEIGASPVIFGEEGDSQLLGAVTLEALGKILDPIRRELRSLKMFMM